jgi:hypothetical protein
MSDHPNTPALNIIENEKTRNFLNYYTKQKIESRERQLSKLNLMSDKQYAKALAITKNKINVRNIAKETNTAITDNNSEGKLYMPEEYKKEKNKDIIESYIEQKIDAKRQQMNGLNQCNPEEYKKLIKIAENIRQIKKTRKEIILAIDNPNEEKNQSVKQIIKAIKQNNYTDSLSPPPPTNTNEIPIAPPIKAFEKWKKAQSRPTEYISDKQKKIALKIHNNTNKDNGLKKEIYSQLVTAENQNNKNDIEKYNKALNIISGKDKTNITLNKFQEVNIIHTSPDKISSIQEAKNYDNTILTKIKVAKQKIPNKFENNHERINNAKKNIKKLRTK